MMKRKHHQPFAWAVMLLALSGATAHPAPTKSPNSDGAQVLHSMLERWMGTTTANSDGATVIFVGVFDTGRKTANADTAAAVVEPVIFDMLAAPSLLTATAVSAVRIDLSWQDNSQGEQGFEIERAPDAGGSPGIWTPIATTGANEARFGDAGLSPETRYYYRVRAYGALGRSPYSNQASATTLPSGPNLRGTLADVSPQPIIVGRDVSFAGQVRNDGDQAATQGFWVEFWAIDPVSGWTGYLCDSIPFSGGLRAGESVELSSFPPRACYRGIPAGTYDSEMRIDATNAIAESREDDNTAVLPGVLVLPDLPNLTIRDFDFSPEDVTTTGGDAIAFAGTIENSGSHSTTGSFRVEVRIWPYPDFEPTGPLLCDSFEITTLLNPGEGVSLDSLPPRTTHALPAGVYSVGIIVDSQDSVAEQNEDDNITWVVRKKLFVGARPTGTRVWVRYR